MYVDVIDYKQNVVIVSHSGFGKCNRTDYVHVIAKILLNTINYSILLHIIQNTQTQQHKCCINNKY